MNIKKISLALALLMCAQATFATEENKTKPPTNDQSVTKKEETVIQTEPSALDAKNLAAATTTGVDATTVQPEVTPAAAGAKTGVEMGTQTEPSALDAKNLAAGAKTGADATKDPIKSQTEGMTGAVTTAAGAAPAATTTGVDTTKVQTEGMTGAVTTAAGTDKASNPSVPAATAKADEINLLAQLKESQDRMKETIRAAEERVKKYENKLENAKKELTKIQVLTGVKETPSVQPGIANKKSGKRKRRRNVK